MLTPERLRAEVGEGEIDIAGLTFTGMQGCWTSSSAGRQRPVPGDRWAARQVGRQPR